MFEIAYFMEINIDHIIYLIIDHLIILNIVEFSGIASMFGTRAKCTNGALNL